MYLLLRIFSCLALYVVMLGPVFCIDINTHSDRKEKLRKIYLKKLFFQNVLVFIDLFIYIITPDISSTQIACDIMW